MVIESNLLRNMSYRLVKSALDIEIVGKDVKKKLFTGVETPVYIPSPFQGEYLPRSGNGIKAGVSTPAYQILFY